MEAQRQRVHGSIMQPLCSLAPRTGFRDPGAPDPWVALGPLLVEYCSFLHIVLRVFSGQVLQMIGRSIDLFSLFINSFLLKKGVIIITASPVHTLK